MENDGKMRMLRILELLRTETDAEHPLSTVQIEQALRRRWGIETYRITIQKDIAALCAAGYGIETIRSTQNKYYMSARLFELPELKLLIDAVESSKFITEKKSRTLTEKLTTLASQSEAGQLRRNISISGRIKAGNEQIYYIMDALNDAINARRKVRFSYFEYDGRKRRQLKNGGEPYVLSPYTLTWNGDFYYVVGFSDKHGKIATFRVDRIVEAPEILPDKAVPKPKQYSIGDFAEKAFQLFDSEHARVELLCENAMMNTVLDHFGEKVKVRKADKEHFSFTAEVSVSPTFFAWVFEFGGKIKILGPRSVRDAYKELLNKSLE
jgi:predicted DNA-binding transcriptional regulator YafY